MIDIDDLRKRPAAYQDAATKKGINLSVEEFLGLDKERRDLQQSADDMRAKKNEVSKKVPAMKEDERLKAFEEMKALSSDLKEKEAILKEVESKWLSIQLGLPSIPLDCVPVGKTEEDNVEVRKEGELPKFDFEPKDHVTLGEELDILDITRGVKVSGSRSYYLKGDGARLQHALIQYTINSLSQKGWTLFSPPLMASYECFMGTGFFPGVDQSNIYAVGGQEQKDEQIESDNLYLIGTSEITVCSYHSGETLKSETLPRKYAGYSACFRREAGTYGKDTKGLYRVHQFEKVEQVVICKADQEESMKLFKEIRNNAEAILKELKLPYRVLDICTGDMGKGKVFMQDIETWMPSRNSYGETHSCSYLGDFQARRLKLKYETEDGKKEFCHTLNNTCIASPRILIPIIETYQNADGSITIPEVLRPYMGGQEIIKKRVE
ncbi:serine--tRNA ligase [Candidatus Peregrinibacteria bacterium]|nr:serine--tRNA ligase [Candidatus Peregrinibacteria bacterium]MBT3599221.1 serine--tRNA ligase [Candidatus Peregrinibacteria bacterium]MBT4367474.1 serine--tRNA ligase [Candidatus Peregrinibacteria bacterium]MBT6731022.1 serine--tRNA ligase [Candidatus Peregrinibacteria bacterium]MBT7009583.1 serine--tRNA ligase [Candidatus Peregrinibacteria bacterium]